MDVPSTGEWMYASLELSVYAHASKSLIKGSGGSDASSGFWGLAYFLANHEEKSFLFTTELGPFVIIFLDPDPCLFRQESVAHRAWLHVEPSLIVMFGRGKGESAICSLSHRKPNFCIQHIIIRDSIYSQITTNAVRPNSLYNRCSAPNRWGIKVVLQTRNRCNCIPCEYQLIRGIAHNKQYCHIVCPTNSTLSKGQ